MCKNSMVFQTFLNTAVKLLTMSQEQVGTGDKTLFDTKYVNIHQSSLLFGYRTMTLNIPIIK